MLVPVIWLLSTQGQRIWDPCVTSSWIPPRCETIIVAAHDTTAGQTLATWLRNDSPRRIDVILMSKDELWRRGRPPRCAIVTLQGDGEDSLWAKGDFQAVSLAEGEI